MSEEQKDQAVLFVLGQLDGEDRSNFVQELESQPDLRTVVREYEAVFAAMALSAEEKLPPAELKAKILARATGNEPISIRESRTRMRMAKHPASFLSWAAAAMLAILCVFLGMRISELERENAKLAGMSNPENFQVVNLAAASEEFPGVSASVVWNPQGGSGVLEARDLPEPPPGKIYQLWVFDGENPAPISAGLFDPTASVRIPVQPNRPVEKAVTFAVSLEVSGGRPQPEGPVVLAGNVEES